MILGCNEIQRHTSQQAGQLDQAGFQKERYDVSVLILVIVQES